MRWLFWGSAILIFYTYLGYLGWLWMRVRLRPWRVLRGPQAPYISVVMVVRNEEQVLESKLRNLLELDYPSDRRQIVVVSDGSTDRTDEILRAYARERHVQAVFNQLSRGKASGLNDALAVAEGEIIVFTDARQKIEPCALRRLMESFADPEVGAVSGELMLGDPASGEATDGMSLYWRLEKRIRSLEAASGSVVGATGALYAVRRQLVPEVPRATILDDIYIPMSVVTQGKRVLFDSTARAWDSPDLGAPREFWRKVRTLSGNYQLLRLAPWLLTSRNRIRFEFISHKLLRLMSPFSLALLFVSSALLSGTVYRIAFVSQLLFYMLALLSLLHLRQGPLARAANAASTFVILNTAAFIAFANTISGRKQEWGSKNPAPIKGVEERVAWRP